MIENLKPYPETKDSGLPWLGEVPAHWEIARGRHLFEIRKRIAGTLGYPVLSITQQGLRLKDVSRGEGQQSQDYSKYQLVKPGEFAMNSMDLITGGVGIATSEGVTSPDYRVFGMRSEDRNDGRFYLLLLRMLYANLAFYSCGQGSAQLGRWRLPRKRFNDFLFPVPPISEQAAIARFLAWATNRLDRAIGAKRRIIALLQEQKQAIIHRVVTRGLDPSVPLKDSGIPWLGEIPEHWEVVSLNAVASVVDPNPSHRNPVYTATGFPFISTVEFVGDEDIRLDTPRRVAESTVIEQERRCAFRPGSIAFSRKGTIGATRIIPHTVRLALLDSVCVINCHSRIRHRYLFRQLGSGVVLAQLGELVRGAALKQVSVGRVRSSRIVLPPLDEQQSLENYLDREVPKVAIAISRLEREITLLREYRTRLIADVVTGKLDVREAAAGLPEESEPSIQSEAAGYDGDEAEDDPDSDLMDIEVD